MSKNTPTIQLENYPELLAQIKAVISKTQDLIKQQKVETAWQIGKLIDANLPKSHEEKYGQSLLKNLETDLKIEQSTLYKMRQFYQSYPNEIPQNSDLNWSHYLVLSSVKDEEKRQELETSATEEKLTVRELKQKAKATETTTKIKSTKPPKLTPNRGKLYSYPIITINQKPHIDLGFHIYRQVEEKIPPEVLAELKKGNALVETTKEENNYKLQNSAIKSPKKINIYQATLERVVDGDTIRVHLDLGFKITHQEILRLRGINAPENKTTEGKIAKKELQKILEKTPYLIIKTTATDIYGRYISDIFLAKNPNDDPQTVANQGQYLNQLLLSKGLAERYM